MVSYLDVMLYTAISSILFYIPTFTIWECYKSSRILPICSTVGLQNQVTPPHSWRYINENHKIFLQPRGKPIDLCRSCLLVMLLLLVLLPERTLGTVVAYITTPKSFNLWQVLLLLPLFPPSIIGTLRCKGHILLLLHLLQSAAIVTDGALQRSSPHLLMLWVSLHHVPSW